jgi:hypothetical protein
MVGFKRFQNVPFNEIPKKDRVKKRTQLAICQGGCNRLFKIDNTTYNLCSTCATIWRYHGHSCDVPNCESVADGSMGFQTRENKMTCINCYQSWRKMDFCIWERFVEERHLYLLRPETFVKALEDGIISPVEKENRVKMKEIAECHHCYREIGIGNPTYQLCMSCTTHLQYHGETCGVCEIRDAHAFDTPESIFVCHSCQYAKLKYKIASYQIYKTQIRIIKNCMICKTPVSHDAENGDRACSACIDHDHDTGKTRGILCHQCNVVEGMIDKMPIDALTYAENLVAYLEHSPLSESWVQKS